MLKYYLIIVSVVNDNGGQRETESYFGAAFYFGRFGVSLSAKWRVVDAANIIFLPIYILLRTILDCQCRISPAGLV